MCGRFALEAHRAQIVDAFALDAAPDMPARYNIAPTQPILIVRGREVPEGSNAPPREAVLARWGLIPAWAKDPKDLPLLINARSETAAQKASFRSAMRHGRALVPASGFYEWRRTPPPGGKGKPVLEPFWVRPKRGGIVAFAGLNEREAAGEPMDTAAIMTVDATTEFSDIHHRMPVVVHPDDWTRWLDVRGAGPGDVADILRTPDDDYFEAVPVSNAVNKVGNQGPELIERVERASAVPHTEASRTPPDTQGDLFG